MKVKQIKNGGKIIYFSLLILGIVLAFIFKYTYDNAKIEPVSPEENIKDLTQYLESFPEDIQALLALGLNYDFSKDYERARDIYIKATEIDPDNALAWHRLGTSYEYLKEYDKVLESYKKTLELSKEDPEASYYYLSQIYLLYDINKSISMAEEQLKIKKSNEEPNLEYTEEYVKFLKKVNNELKQKDNIEPYIELIESEYVPSDAIKLGLVEKTLEKTNEEDKKNMEKLINIKETIEKEIY